jgi:hypothetical protein
MVLQPRQLVESQRLSPGRLSPRSSQNLAAKKVVVEKFPESPVFTCLAFMPVFDRMVLTIVGQIDHGLWSLCVAVFVELRQAYRQSGDKEFSS